MDIHDLTIDQLKRAVAIKEQIENLNHELSRLLGGSDNSRSALTKSRTISAAVRKRIAATQKARWANLRHAKQATRSAKPAAKAVKKTMLPATRARLSTKLKAYWAAKKKNAKK